MKIEIQIAEKLYQFLFEPESPLEHVKEALFQFQKEIGNTQDKIQQQLNSQTNAQEEVPKEEPKPEEKSE